MFSSASQLKKRTPENGTDRENFLSSLVDEYLNSSSLDAKCQVLANLANFAYDPINYGYIRDVGVLDIFLHVLKNEGNQRLQRFACAGICNLCVDPLNAEYLLKYSGLQPLIALLNSKCPEILADIITTLTYLLNGPAKAQINQNVVIQKVQELETFTDTRVSNLAKIFLKNVVE